MSNTTEQQIIDRYRRHNFLTGDRPPNLSVLPEADVDIMRGFLERDLDRYVAIAAAVRAMVASLVEAGIVEAGTTDKVAGGAFQELRDLAEGQWALSDTHDQQNRIHAQLEMNESDWLMDTYSETLHTVADEVLGVGHDG